MAWTGKIKPQVSSELVGDSVESAEELLETHKVSPDLRFCDAYQILASAEDAALGCFLLNVVVVQYHLLGMFATE